MATHDGDGHIRCAQGHTHWGKFGAAGMLLDHTDPNTGIRRYFLQHRSPHVMEGGTWGIPGGAIDSHETPEVAAYRELAEEVGHPSGLHSVRHLHTADHGGWQYHTIGGTVPDGPEGPWEPSSGEGNHETMDTGWFTPAEISELPLHPGFAKSWDELQSAEPAEAGSGGAQRIAVASVAHRSTPPLAFVSQLSVEDPAPLSSGSGEIGGPVTHVLDHLSLSSVAHNLHYRFAEQGLDPAAAKDYASRLLKMLGYPTDEITVLAAIQAWQQLYPGDDPLSPSAPIPVATTPTQSLGYGTISKDQSWLVSPLARDSTTLTLTSSPPTTLPSWRFSESSTGTNSPTPIPLLYFGAMTRTARLTYTIDPELLDPALFGPDGTYHGPIPPEAVLDVNQSTVPSEVNNPEDHWPEFGQQPPDHHYDPQTSNDTIL